MRRLNRETIDMARGMIEAIILDQGIQTVGVMTAEENQDKGMNRVFLKNKTRLYFFHKFKKLSRYLFVIYILVLKI